MYNKKELVVPFNNSNNQFLVIFFPILIVICMLWYALILYFSGILPDIILIVLKAFVILGIAIFTLGFFSSLTFLFNTEPAAILNEKGIWVKYYGFIAWDEIQEIGLLQVGTIPVKSIGIRVYDNAALSKRAPFSGKMGIFWSKITGYPPINLANLAIENDVIIEFIKQYVETQQS